MVKAIISRFKVKKGKEPDFEKIVKGAVKASSRKGNEGAVLMRSVDDPSSYTVVSYWQGRQRWESFMKEYGTNEKLKPYLQTDPVREWHETVARLQFGKFLAPKKR